MTAASGRVLHVVSHTHWDREWYLPFEAFRSRLVLLIDNLLTALQDDPDFRHFYLDGQAVLLADYLEVRPRHEPELRRRIAEGRIQVGPWYVAGDEGLVSGESLIRNLGIGLRTAAGFGRPVRVGYLPDQFGHVSQMPQILRGFGISSAVLGRGLNRGRHRNELVWSSPDGSRVFCLFLATWYSNARNVPAEPSAAARFLAAAAERTAAGAGGPHLLLMNGVDHLEAQPGIGRTLQAAAGLLEDQVVHDSLEGALEAIREAVGEAVETVPGELREDAGGRLDAGTLSARMPLKLENHAATRRLECAAEPLAAWAGALGGADLRDLLQHGWRKLLQNHPHDSIGGCAVDPVALQMRSRFQAVRDIGSTVAERAARDLAATFAPCTPEPGAGATGVLLFNAGRERSGQVLTMTVDLPLAEPSRQALEVGPDAARTRPALEPAVSGPGGRRLEAQLHEVRETRRLVLAPDRLPRVQPVLRARLSVAVELPGLGLMPCRVGLVPAGRRTRGPGLARSPRRLGNRHLEVEVTPDGGLWLTHLASGRRLGPLHVVEDGGDRGDCYHYVPPARDRVLTSAAADQVELLEDGPLSAALHLRYRLEVPAGLTVERHARSAERTSLELGVTVRLRRDEPWLGFETVVDNAARDHRLRVRFPTGARTDRVCSGSAFDAIERPVELPEDWPGAAAQRIQMGWTDAAGGDGFGVTLLSAGLPEIEPAAGPEGVELALTLLRCVGAVSRGSAIPMVLEAPEAQCPGRHRFQYALYPHQGAARPARAWSEWERFCGRCLVFDAPDLRLAEARAPVLVEGEAGFVLSAVKPPDGAGAGGRVPFDLVVRGFSAAATPIQVRLRFDRPPRRAYLLDLSEGVEREAELRRGALELEVEPARIVTVGVAL